MDDDNLRSPATEINEKLISSFIKNTSSSREEAKFFLETHQWDLNAAVSAFTENNVSDAAVSAFTQNNNVSDAAAESNVLNLATADLSRYSNLRIDIPVASHSISSNYYIPSPSGIWLRPLSQATLSRDRNPFSRKRAADTPCESEMIKRCELSGNEPTLAEVSGGSKDSGSGDNDGGEPSEKMIVQEPEEGDDADDKDEESDEEPEPQVVITTEESKGYCPTKDYDSVSDDYDGGEHSAEISGGRNDSVSDDYDGGGQSDDVDEKDEESDVERPVQSSPRIVSAEAQVVITFFVTVWRNGYTVDDGPLHELDIPRDGFIEDGGIGFRIKLIRRQDVEFNESPNPNTLIPFQGVGRTIGEKDSAATEPPASSESLTTTPQPSISLVIDPTAPTTSIQIRLADGTHIVSGFNSHHTVRDIRDFIDASRPGGSNDYQLLVGFPPKPLLDFDQTIEEAGISNSILIQKY